MNKSEKLICLVLGALLAWYIWSEMGKQKERAAAQPTESLAVQATTAEQPTKSLAEQTAEQPAAAAARRATEHKSAEKTVTLENELVKLELSNFGGVVKKATLKTYALGLGEVSAENPAVALDFRLAPLGAIGGLACVAPDSDYEVKSASPTEVVFANDAVERKITLKPGYQIVYEDTFLKGTDENAITSLSLGAMAMGGSKNDLLSVDSYAENAGKGKPGVVHHSDDDSPLKPYLVGGLTGGCSGSKSAAGMPAKAELKVNGAQRYIALKNRFFVTALASCDQGNLGFDAAVTREVTSANYRPEAISAAALFGGAPAKRVTVFYAGPKKQSLLWDLGMKDVMEFGMWRWLCYPLVWVLNLFNDFIPNYGVAIILLTILVRILFWPLTHKSTVGMKKMQEIQPLMKEIQARCKDNPQKLQQETWALYRDHKVNPMSSCLPMLIQIPVFIALFNVLRSAVELRYAPFLWIADLSEPEGLFASWFPFGGLNLLPILMAVTTALQSYFTPSAGDKKQQQMMMIMMPAMMLVMFYSFPAALSLYWFLSNLFSIVQMYLIRRATAKEQGAVITPEVIDPPATRQMKRHG